MTWYDVFLFNKNVIGKIVKMGSNDTRFPYWYSRYCIETLKWKSKLKYITYTRTLHSLVNHKDNFMKTC